MQQTNLTRTTPVELPTLAGSSIPVPGNGPVLFADSEDRPTAAIRAIHPDGTTRDVTPQSGTATLVAGVTALIPATITEDSRIVVTLKTPDTTTDTVNYAALDTDRVVGLASGDGGFKITALVAAGTINVADVSTLDWVVFN